MRNNELNAASQIKTVSDIDKWGGFEFLGDAYEYPAGAELFRQNSRIREIFFVVRGFVKLVSSEVGQRKSVVSLGYPGWVLGGQAAILGEAHSTTAIALTTCKLLRLESSNFRRLLLTNPRFSWKVHEMHSREASTQLRHMAALMILPAEQRLIRLLTEFLITLRLTQNPEDGRLPLPLKFWELASLLAITPPYLSRLLSRLQRAGLLRRHKGWIVLAKNPAADVWRAAESPVGSAAHSWGVTETRH